MNYDILIAWYLSAIACTLAFSVGLGPTGQIAAALFIQAAWLLYCDLGYGY